VQTTLLGIAIAIILALVAALVAPLVVDWSHYRSAFEDEASRLTGLAVHVNGTIDARILPSPHIKLRDVEVGAAGREPRVRAAAVELDIGLGPLIRGEVQATQVRLLAPQIRLGLDKAGALDWPKPSSAFQADALTVSHLSVENGRVTLSDAASGSHFVLEKVSFDGDVRSFFGPFNGDGAFVAGGEPYAFRISGNRVGDDGRLKLRLGVDPADQPLTAEIDGLLGFHGGVPQFDGTLSLARLVGATLAGGARVMSIPWQLAGKISATPAAATLQDLAFQYGPEERAAAFKAKAALTFGDHPHLDGEISAAQVDVDRMLAAPDVTHRPPLVMFKSFLEGFMTAVRPPLPVAVGVAIEAVTVGGATLQSLHGHVRFDARQGSNQGWGLDDFAFRAPGFTTVSLSGRLGASSQGFMLDGPVSIESTDMKILVAWLEGRGDQPSGPAQTMSARGDVTITNNRFVLDRLAASLDQEKVEGRLAYTWAAGDRPAALDGDMRAATLDVDALTAFAKAAASDGAFEVPRDVALALDVGKATVAGIDARTVNARLTLNAGILHIDRLSIGDLGGAALDVSGRIDELSSQPRGQLTLDINASTLEGLTNIAGRYAPTLADSLRPFADRLAPAKIHGVLTIDRVGKVGSVAKLDLGGTVGALRLALNGEAAGAAAHAGAAVVRLTSRLDADDGGALVRLLDLDRLLAVDQLPGQMTVSANGPLDGDIRINGLAAAGGFSAAAAGTLHLHGEAPTGSLQLKASAADLRPLYRTMTGQANVTAPVSLSAIVGIAGSDISVTDLAMTAGKSSLRGRLDLKMASPVGIGGEIAADEVDAATVAALLLGLPSAAPGAAKPWSPSPVGPGAFAAATGTVNFKVDRAALTPSLVARDLKGVVRFTPPEIALNDIDGKLAGGHLTAGLTFRRDPPSFAGQGYVELANANAATMAGNANAVDGSLAVKLQGESQGLSPDGIVGAFHGGGSIALTHAQFAGLNPAAFDAAIRLVDQSGAVDAAKIRAVVGAAMDNSKLAVPKADAEVTIAAGQIRVANATLAAQGGSQLSLAGVLDLNTAAIDAQMTLSGQPAVNALIDARPELSVGVKGPLAAPERKVDVSALVGWLTLRAAEQQTRRVESLEANRRPDVLGNVARPAPPMLRFIPRGTTLEVSNHASATSPSGVNGLDRLRSEIPAPAAAAPALPPPSPGPSKPAVPGAAPGADKTSAAGAAPPAPQQSLRSFFNSLFGSQN
jgi:uncharacterized protein involved in outer membrane biogenesis